MPDSHSTQSCQAMQGIKYLSYTGHGVPQKETKKNKIIEKQNARTCTVEINTRAWGKHQNCKVRAVSVLLCACPSCSGKLLHITCGSNAGHFLHKLDKAATRDVLQGNSMTTLTWIWVFNGTTGTLSSTVDGRMSCCQTAAFMKNGRLKVQVDTPTASYT